MFRKYHLYGLDAGNLTLLHANKKGVDQPVHPRSLVIIGKYNQSSH